MRPASGPLTAYSAAMGRILCPNAAALFGLACAGAAALALSPTSARADWFTAPVVPKLGRATTHELVATRRRGSKLGNRADVFAKAGDSISASPAFLQSLGCGQWKPGRYGGLKATVRYFSTRRLPGRSSQCRRSNSFSRNSSATRAFIPALWAIDPAANPGPPCLTGEPPLACEIRLDRPAYAVVLFGANDVNIALGLGGDPVPGYLASMSELVSSARRLGVVPILTTLSPRRDSSAAEAMTERMNDELWHLATARRVPLINLWRALVPLPNQGLTSDGLHLSVSGSPGCASPCDPNGCAPRCFAANFTNSGLRSGSDMRNLITLRTLARLSRIAAGPKR